MLTRAIYATFGAAAAAAALLAAISCGEHRATGIEPPPAAANSSSPTLVECPTNQTQSNFALVGVMGGTVQVGGTSITIPGGALLSPTLITVTVPSGQYLEVDVQANQLTSFLFQKPVSITIDYSRCNRANIESTPLTVWHIDPITKSLIENMGGTDDKASQSVTFTTGHLSGYAVAN
ncbi:MAG TPA: hypothetical protein VJU87_06530 [Gemmatimonadaceae bacterium]|nr:hypothetical protein [Gemmatimonadaceae bacterium]